MSKKSNVPSDEIQNLLKTVYEDCMKEDLAVRERQVRLWRRLKLLWEGFNRVWYSETAHDWRIWDATSDESSDQSTYDKPINVFKAYLESIIAALSVTVPPVKCYPDDADNTLDLATAKAGDKISQLIYRHNDVSLLWLHALFIYCTEGMTACYSYPVASNEYGTYEEKEYEDVSEEHDLTTCPNCAHVLNDDIAEPNSPVPTNQSNQQPPELADDGKTLVKQEEDEFMPDNEDAELQYALSQGSELCPACMMMMDPEIKREKFITTRLVGITNQPKTRICMEVYGGLYVKIANYAKKQKDLPYLILSYECDYSMVFEEYEHLHGNSELKKQIKGGLNVGAYNLYEQWGRLSPQYQGEYPENVVTKSQCWIRAAKFNILDKDQADKLKKLYPNGCKVVFINDQFATAENESLDDCWTITENPLSDFLHFEPLGESLESVQEITNDLISLVLQTIEHGIGQTFADPAVIDFKAYAQTEVTPGGIFPATPKSGKQLGDGFHELRTATLSAEVMPFSANIQSLGQLVSGATPSIFGGQLQGVGGETASGYSMSRAQALQRLQNTWKMYTLWWKNIFGKCIPIFINEVKDDERTVEKDNDGNFINTFIRKAELEGKIGRVELEANENLPLTWGQQKDMLMQLLTNQNPLIQKLLNSPENLTVIHDALGLVDFFVPGEDDIIKQYDEIKLLLNSEPIQTGDPNNPETSSVDIDPINDNNQIEFEICRKWIISPAGRQTKIDNEPGYRNVLLHGKAHYQQMMPPPPMPPLPTPKVSFAFKGEDLLDPQVREILDRTEQIEPTNNSMVSGGPGVAPSKRPNPLLSKDAPITGDNNVSTVQ